MLSCRFCSTLTWCFPRFISQIKFEFESFKHQTQVTVLNKNKDGRVRTILSQRAADKLHMAFRYGGLRFLTRYCHQIVPRLGTANSLKFRNVPMKLQQVVNKSSVRSGLRAAATNLSICWYHIAYRHVLLHQVPWLAIKILRGGQRLSFEK